MDIALRPRSATEIVDAAVRLFRRHIAGFLTLAAVSAVPRLLIGLGQFAVSRNLGFAAGNTGTALNPFAAFASGPYLLLTLASLLVYGAFEGAFVSLADDGLRGGSASAGWALGRGLGRAVPVTLTFLAVTLVTVVGLFLLIVPGIYLGVRLYPAVATAALEDVGPGEALARAWRRTAGSVGRGCVVFLIVFLLVLLVSLAASALGGLVGAALGGASRATGGALAGAVITGLVANVIASLVAYPVISTAATVFYYDTRVRAEGLDVELMADALGRPSAAAY